MKKKILIFSSFFPPERGAAANRIYNMAAGLKDQGFDVEVVSPLPNYPKGKIFPEYAGKLKVREEFDGITVNRYWIYPTISKNPLMRVLGMLSFSLSLVCAMFSLKRIRPDICIIQGHPMFVSWTAVVISKWVLKAKVLLNVSDIWPLSALEMGAIKKGRMYSILEWIERFNYRHSDAILGQSNEILEHVNSVAKSKDLFLYRNLPRKLKTEKAPSWHAGKPRIVYAGLLGYAQGIADLVQNIDWDEMGIELSIYGDGGDREKITSYLRDSGIHSVTLHGMVSPEKLSANMPNYHAALVPLATRIQGAVPSKLYELAHQQMPVLFSGGGEGASIVGDNHLGFLSPPGDVEALRKNLIRFKQLSKDEYEALVAAAVRVAEEEFDFGRQMEALSVFVEGIA